MPLRSGWHETQPEAQLMGGRATRPRQVEGRRSNFLALTPDLAEALVKCRSEGLCYLGCSDHLGVSTTVIARWVNELGLRKRLNRGRASAAQVLAERRTE